MKQAHGYFHVLAKPTGAVCNLDCTYCFFLSKEALYPESDFRMKDDLLEIYVRQLLESQPEQVQVAWQGGEPTLMGLEFFERMMALVEKYRRPGQRVEHTIQTNGTRLDDAWCAFFKQHGFLVGLSVDGPRSVARYVSRGQGRARDVRPGDARVGAAAEAHGGDEHSVHGACGERGAWRGGVSVLSRRAGCAVYAVHPDCGARGCGHGAGGESGLGCAAGREVLQP